MTADQETLNRASRLFTYLKRFKRLQTKVVRKWSDREQVVWFDQVPQVSHCRCIARSSAVATDDAEEIWLEVCRPKRQACPNVPKELQPWLDMDKVQDATQETLRPRQEYEVPWTQSATNTSGKVAKTVKQLAEYPGIRERLQRYINEKWQPWAEQDRREMEAEAVYELLYSIHQKLQQQSEEYELILGLGLLAWQKPNADEIRRHVITVPATLTFDEKQAVLRVGPAEDGGPRLEVDMLDVADCPRTAEQTLKRQVAEIDELWTGKQVQNALKTFVHDIPSNARGKFENVLERPRGSGPDPLIHLAPALVLRKRSELIFDRHFDAILSRIEDTKDIPAGIRHLLGTRASREMSGQHEGHATRVSETDEDVYFPLPANDEQKAILHKLTTQRGVVVQGPPGTGKSHTIVNLICHLLATGKRILVTSHTARALKVLREKIPDDIANLCVMLLGEGRDAFQDLEQSVQGITARFEQWESHSQDMLTTIRRLATEVDSTRRAESATLQELRALREKEVHVYPPMFGDYQGTAQSIAQRIHTETPQYGWLPDRPSGETAPPVNDSEALELLRLLRELTRERLAEAKLTGCDPQALPLLQAFTQAMERERELQNRNTALARYREHAQFATLARSPAGARQQLIEELDRLGSQLHNLQLSGPAWAKSAVPRFLTGDVTPWEDLLREMRSRLREVVELVADASGTLPPLPMEPQANAALWAVQAHPQVVEYVRKNLDPVLRRVQDSLIGADGIPRFATSMPLDQPPSHPDLAKLAASCRSYPLFIAVARCEPERRRKLASTLKGLDQTLRDLSRGKEAWVNDALAQVAAGQTRYWADLFRATEKRLRTVAEEAEQGDDCQVEGLGQRAPGVVKTHAEALHDHLAAGRGLGFWVFRAKVVRETEYLWREVRVNGRSCATAETLRQLIVRLDTSEKLAGLQRLWGKHLTLIADEQESLTALASTYQEAVTKLEQLLRLHENIEEIRRLLPLPAGVAEPSWHSLEEVHKLQAAIAAVPLVEIHDLLMNLRQRWAAMETVKSDDVLSQITAFRQAAHWVEQLFRLARQVQKVRPLLPLSPGVPDPHWHNAAELRALRDVAAHVDAIHTVDQESAQVGEGFVRWEQQLAAAATQPRPHPALQATLTAVQQRQPELYGNALVALEQWHSLNKQFRRLRSLQERLQPLAPELWKQLHADSTQQVWETRLQQFVKAWNWARAVGWLERFSDPQAETKLATQVENHRARLRDALRRLAAERAWEACLRGMTDEHRSSLIAWNQAIRKVGKGTGKHAQKHRRHARRHMQGCRGAIPAWVMPLHRVAESVTPEAGAFDVAIIDEASQSGPEAILLMYLAKQVVVVGDDKQISPEFVGIDGNEVDKLSMEYLADLPFREKIGNDYSFFDYADLQYQGRIRLREHFRCMPEIIEFSNRLCYSGQPLVPLRQFGSSRLEPVIVTRHVREGYRKEIGSKVTNPPEAEALAKCIVECCRDQRYSDKSMGVISLQGDDQAKLIADTLLKLLGPKELEERRLICGDAYAFQGDERDVVFLSLVAAPRDGKFADVLTKDTDVRRFNVAASRAKDQLWLFYTVTLSDLNPESVRHKLLAYCLKPTVDTVPGGTDLHTLRQQAHLLDRRREKPPSPFDSWFEVDVYLQIAGRGYLVRPQFNVAGYHIDFVVEGHQGRLAVECDGDYWHGPEHYEKDMGRQRMLERCGWKFWRVRGSTYYRDPEQAMMSLWNTLQRLGITPSSEALAPTS